MSLGGSASSAVDSAVNGAIADGVTFAVAAGNDNANACNSSPARAPSALTVGATTSTDARSSFSNFGTCVDLFAPGSSITSSWYTSDTATNTISGTSMATPHVTGVAALYLQGAPTATAATVSSAIVNGATPNKVTNPGTGSPNRLLYSLLGAAPPPDTTPPDTTITAGPAEGTTTTDSTPTFGFTSSESGSTFQCQDDTGAWTGCVSPSDRGPFTNASHTFRVRAIDAAGNVDPTPATRTFTVNATTPTGCGLNASYSGTLSGTGASVYLPSSTGYTTTVSGTQRACLTGPSTADFDLYLFKRNAFGSWSQVARSISTSSTESIAYSGTAGTYRVQVISYSGSGAYTAGITHP
jgi:serine protease